ncbi:hypothetical protein [Polymorphum gilvum]|uniref:Hypothetical conserved protein n=1 Tax=Polymorphum gilvum (strain LMG 25793 / CGMCC 1.9160 / SL003B-26A1) TaxID=991905 RepID=F2IVC2_POLGS|nr:hypothetical protein [Polymorphum gilvum]ADZ72640.1 Hypothetical conserved protein [Polymorphum gilvum SL003B-26A1]
MSTHRYAIGQSVRLNTGTGGPSRSGDTYRITATLPTRDNYPQYRIRNDDERHDRVASEDTLEAVKTQQPFFRTR